MQESSHQHEQHGHGTTSSGRKLGVVTLLNLAGFVLEVAGGFLFGSVALLGDAIHMLFDATAYATAYGAAYVAEAVEASEEWTYGYHRVEVVSALFNGLLLIPMAGWIVWESYRRFMSPVTVEAGPAIAVASLGLVVNVVSVLYLR
ncbi:MAG: cation diffusion facilitator family transporter, partial [Candidatus Nanohaloarchaea archaeon]|nr:cation diffusion facilitator family transporter [Candidatus Nanohaloarchaea archaeon]